MAMALGMAVSVHAPRYRFGRPGSGVVVAASLAELLESADIASLHCSLNQQTRGMIGRDAFAAMPRGSWLINVARGPVVDEAALIEALQSGQLGGAALDVHAQEPMHRAHPLLAMDNVVLTPHVAGATLQWPSARTPRPRETCSQPWPVTRRPTVRGQPGGFPMSGDATQADIVVVGAGLAGFCAAIEAAGRGAEVLLLEKQARVGGSTVLSGGSMAFAGTDAQESAGIADSNEPARTRPAGCRRA